MLEICSVCQNIATFWLAYFLTQDSLNKSISSYVYWRQSAGVDE